jgi:transposase InsO family protein
MRYHANATTNINQRQYIQESDKSCRSLADELKVTAATVCKWNNADSVHDKSCEPKTKHYALSEYERQLICGFRQLEWHSLDDIVLLFDELMPKLKRSNCYRTLKRNGLNRKPKKKKESGEFADYEPGYIHIDVFYLPKLNGERRYVFVAIDRTTKMVNIEVYPDKSQLSALDFLKRCVAFFPFKIHTILTDNGKEFTLHNFRNRYGKTDKTHVFSAYARSQGIKHKTTKVRHPWTNGQVERMNGILEEKTIKRYHYENHQQIEQHLKRIQIYWNYYKRHKTLNLKTIPQVLKKWYDKKPDIFRMPYYQLPFTML